MSAYLTIEGQTQWMNQVISDLTTNLKIGLFKALAGAGGKVAVLADITPCDFSGYAAQSTTWAAATVDGNQKSTRDGGTYTFTHNAGVTNNTVLGYYVWDDAHGVLLWQESFSAPILMNANGQTIPISPTMYSGDASTPL